MLFMEFKLPTKEQVKSGAEMTWRFSKKIVKKGAQAMVLETAANVLNATFEGDASKVKEQLTFDAIVGPKKESKPKRKLFSKKKKDEAEEVLDEVAVVEPPVDWQQYEEVDAKDVKVVEAKESK
jgi:hypothetical protein